MNYVNDVVPYNYPVDGRNDKLSSHIIWYKNTVEARNTMRSRYNIGTFSAKYSK